MSCNQAIVNFKQFLHLDPKLFERLFILQVMLLSMWSIYLLRIWLQKSIRIRNSVFTILVLHCSLAGFIDIPARICVFPEQFHCTTESVLGCNFQYKSILKKDQGKTIFWTELLCINTMDFLSFQNNMVQSVWAICELWNLNKFGALEI